MESLTRLRGWLTDDRFDANLIAVYGAIVVTVIGYLVLLRLLRVPGAALAERTGLHWLGWVDTLRGEATRRARTGLFWLTGALVVLHTSGGIAYHSAGRDVRVDFHRWYSRFSFEELLAAGAAFAGVIALAIAARFSARLVHRLRPGVQKRALKVVGHPGNQAGLERRFNLFERYAAAAVRLLCLWGAAELLGASWVGAAVGFLLRVATILVAARLLTMACRSLSGVAAEIGDRSFQRGGLARYWERLKRLFPFGERCFEAAVYVLAASLCVRVLHFVAFVAAYGPLVVECIGIFFATRVVIELLQVVLNQAFDLYDDNPEADHTVGRTLVPLLYSICQYAVYFGSVVLMLSVLGVPTTPILAGASVLGLAVGLGAQSLVTDVVSGFFILFENQYLVGDFVQIGDAAGIVEAVGIRLTQIRDGQGRLYLIPNGQIKGVVNYSKGFVNAVVDLRVPTGSDLEGVVRAMADAGRKLRQSRKEVMAETEINGLVDLGSSDMTIRAITRVQPGSHMAMQNEYRRLLKHALDQTSAKQAA